MISTSTTMDIDPAHIVKESMNFKMYLLPDKVVGRVLTISTNLVQGIKMSNKIYRQIKFNLEIETQHKLNIEILLKVEYWFC